MKATLYYSKGSKKSQIELPKIFSMKVREDLAAKYFEADKFIQPYAPFREAGMRQSASGTISHQRHDWKGHYGKGISRVPRKTMSRRGTQFFWVGANIPGSRGGRKAHPPKGIGKEKKINKKEIQLAINSGFAATAQEKFLVQRYSSLDKIENTPLIFEALPEKTKELVSSIKSILKENSGIAFRKKTVRAGKGKLRGRKYKSNAGILIITSNKENPKFKSFDVKTLSEVTISDLYPLGRLTIFTKQALEQLNEEEKK